MAPPSSLTRRSALGLIAGGTILVVSSSFGYSQIAGERLASFRTASDEEALIALVERSYDTIPNNSFLAVADLVNNIPDDVSVMQYHLSTNQNGVSIRFNGETSSTGGSLSGSMDMPEGGTVPIELRCSTPGQISGEPVFQLQLATVNAQNTGISIEEVTFDLPFVCRGGAVLQIGSVRGLTDSRTATTFDAEIDIEEINNTTTQNLTVSLSIVDSSGSTIFNETKAAPADFDDVRDGIRTVPFSIQTLFAGMYTYTVTATAANATTKTFTDSFHVDDELLIIDLDTARTGARTLVVNALNRSGEPVDLVAVSVEHDPDGTANRTRTQFETLTIDVGVTGTDDVSMGSRNDELPGVGTRIDHHSHRLANQSDARYHFERWEGSGNISGEEFIITIWGIDSTGDEKTTSERVTLT